jgi:hypothetical protein
MTEVILVAASPCLSCPYRKDTPAGIWHPDEYAKLRRYDEPKPGELPALAPFMCHHSPFIGQDTYCRGWLSVHADSIAVRLQMIAGNVSPEAVYADVAEPLYASGNEAADAGLKGCRRPGKKAKQVIAKLDARRKKAGGSAGSA